MSIAIILLTPMNYGLKLCALLFVVIYGFSILKNDVFLRNKNSILSIRRDSENKWYVVTKEGFHLADLNGDSTVTSFVSALRFRIHNQSRIQTCIIFRDSLADNLYRQLLVEVRMC